MERQPPEPLSRPGVAYALLAYVVWGFAPIFWKLTVAYPSTELLAYRVLSSVLIGLAVAAITGAGPALRDALRSWRSAGAVLAAALMIAINWLTFIYAVQTDRILATSLGYYINPLVNVLFGLVLLGERLSRVQGIAVGLAAAGVAIQTLLVGELPWISLVLAGSFGLYGLVRKLGPAEPVAGFALETAVLTPIALAYLGVLGLRGEDTIRHDGFMTWLLVAGSGLLTAVPLLAFASAARRLPLSTLGMFQYIAPSLAFALAVAFYGETLTTGHGASFGCVWLALALFAWDSSRGSARRAGVPEPAEARS